MPERPQQQAANTLHTTPPCVNAIGARNQGMQVTEGKIGEDF
ncbi:hypothetical protein Krac_9058 [Ktedonobacter racemifer DSM 44963]|uniref:Uncharacterized protein n=1 Tax=Ktedonobacter racemifer DSM 44963 TaxID=485913 RepID=D6TQP5_KTERA|nr:hypothetical protein Krac_9058 [Ktedonobacter racemifer DSM 44963]